MPVLFSIRGLRSVSRNTGIRASLGRAFCPMLTCRQSRPTAYGHANCLWRYRRFHGSSVIARPGAAMVRLHQSRISIPGEFPGRTHRRGHGLRERRRHEPGAARAFSTEQDAGSYRVVVVRFPTEVADIAGEFDHAAEPFRQRGEVLFDQAGEYEDIDAYEINVIDPDGRQIYASFVYHDRHLYIAEGSVGADAFPPIQFQQSMWITDAAGNPIGGERRLGN